MRSILLLLVLVLGATAAPITGPAGYWEGEISLAGTRLGIRVDLERTNESWSGTINIPVQGLRGFRLEPVNAEGAAVTFAMPNVPGSPTFIGQLNQEVDSISGDYSQGTVKASFKLDRRPRPAAVAGEAPVKG